MGCHVPGLVACRMLDPGIVDTGPELLRREVVSVEVGKTGVDRRLGIDVVVNVKPRIQNKNCTYSYYARRTFFHTETWEKA